MVMKKGETLAMTIILLFSTILCVSGTVSAEDSEILIDSAVEWNDDQTVSGIYRIIEGGSLTISDAVLSMESGSSIIVETGGLLDVNNAELNALEPPTGLAGYRYWDAVNRSAILIPGSDYDSAFSATFHAPDGGSFYGGLAYVGDDETGIGTNGSEFTLEFDDTINDIWIGMIGLGQNPVSVSSVTLTPELGNPITHDAIDMQYRNMMALGDSGFTISVSGTMDLEDSTIYGGEIIVNGSATIHDSNIVVTGPIIADSIDSDVMITGTTMFNMSKDDHDVRLHAKSQFHWGDEATGSGGHTDRWERRISNQQVQFDAIEVLFRIIDMGPDEIISSIYFSNEEGIGMVDSGNERVVEIGWADGSVWTEIAEIEIVEYRTAWNWDEDMDNYGGDFIPLTWDPIIVVDSNIPNIQWVSLEYSNTDDRASLNAGVGMLATIANRGSASAVVYLGCDITETGVDTNVGSYPGGEKIDPNTEVTIQFSWRHNAEEEVGITCEILTPTQLVEDDAFGGGSASAESITWYQPGDNEDGSILPIVIALLIGASVTGYAFFRMSKQSDSDDEEDMLY